ncbi:Glycosyl transferase family 25 [Trinorchestia longiramus]|nr:Glycosyl transferase family 25 [Trinorchestia longiramus]
MNVDNFLSCNSPLPLIQIVLLVRNKAPVLPYTLTHLYELLYPRDRIILYVRADHCHDRSVDILEEWLHHVDREYYKTDIVLDRSERKFQGDDNPRIYSTQSHKHVVQLKEAALNNARENDADFVFFLDADVVITFPDLLNHLIRQNKSIVGPLMNLGDYSHKGNYWPEFEEYVWRKPWTRDVLDLGRYNNFDFAYRNIQTCMAVFLVHSCVLINLKEIGVKTLTFDYRRLQKSNDDHHLDDDMLIFALSAQENHIPMYICNLERYGVFLPPTVGQSDQKMEQEFKYLLVNVVDLQMSLLPGYLTKYEEQTKALDKLGFDEIYYINLDRRPERRKTMEFKFKILNIGPVLRVPAFDGRNLNESFLSEKNIKAEENYKSKFTKLPLTRGEIGCFLSHYHVWQNVVSKRYQKVLVFEDDFIFFNNFRFELNKILDDVRWLSVDWDIISLSRLSLNYDIEEKVEGSEMLVEAYTSHWTVAYMLSYAGANKLIAQQPLSKIIPVDLYFSAMADKLSMESKLSYEPRNLRFLASTKFLGRPVFIENVDSSFISDTAHYP